MTFRKMNTRESAELGVVDVERLVEYQPAILETEDYPIQLGEVALSEDLLEDFKGEVKVIRATRTFPKAKAELERRGLKPLKELFNYCYHTQGLTVRSIAGMLHKSSEATGRAMKGETVPLRPRAKPLDFWELGEKEKRLPPTFMAEIGTYARRNIWAPSLDDIYLLGLIFSDGGAYLDVKPDRGISYAVYFCNGCHELVEKAAGLMARFGKPSIEYYYCWVEDKVLYRKYLKPEERERANYWKVRVYSKRLFDALKINPHETNYKTISHCLKTKNRATAFIRGFGDGDISVEERAISFFQTDYKLAYAVSEALDRHFRIPTATREVERDLTVEHPHGVYTFRTKGIAVTFYGKVNFRKYHTKSAFNTQPSGSA